MTKIRFLSEEFSNSHKLTKTNFLSTTFSNESSCVKIQSLIILAKSYAVSLQV